MYKVFTVSMGLFFWKRGRMGGNNMLLFILIYFGEHKKTNDFYSFINITS